VRIEVLRGGRFDVGDWVERQLTNGRLVQVEHPDGSLEVTRALGVDSGSGGLVVEERPGGGERVLLNGEIRHLRLAGLPPVQAAPSGNGV
jgi:hypothetical protein